MNEETRKKLNIWMGVFPESYHSLDQERLFDLIAACIKNGDRIDSDDLQEIIRREKKWDDKFREEFVDEKESIIDNVIDFSDYLREKYDIDLKNLL